MLACANAETYNGTWNIEPSSQSSMVHLRLEYRHVGSTGDEEWDESRDVPLSALSGLSEGDLRSSGEHKSFTISRDAGQIRADGWLASGRGSGTWTFAASPAFVQQLARRGIAAPNEKQQFELAMSGFSFATLDGLLAAGFERPSLDDLIAMIDHGVTDRYIQALRGVPMHPKTVAELIRLRDHGVTPDYASRMMSYVPSASADDLIRMRDHGVTPAYVERLRSHGYTHLSADDLIRLRDHGV
jgi:hypothetical protein